MQDQLNSEVIDDMVIGNLKGLANELDRFGDDMSDSNIKTAITSIVSMIGGGLVGYGIGTVLDNLDYLVSLL